MLIPDETLDLPYPRALDDPDGRFTAQLKERLLEITRRHSASMQVELRQLEAEGLVDSASIEVRHVMLTPTSKLYLVGGEQALHGPYKVVERPIVLDDEVTVDALDVLGLGAQLTHYVQDDNPDSRGSVFMESWQSWFNSVWEHLAR